LQSKKQFYKKMKTRKTLATLAFTALCATAHSQDIDSLAYRAYLYNNNYKVYMRINFYDNDVVVPGQELYGELPGYLSKEHNSFCWLITSAKINDDHSARIEMVNDYGSEDLSAELVRQNDSIYVLRQLSGSALKVPNNSKWQKLPKNLELKRKK